MKKPLLTMILLLLMGPLGGNENFDLDRYYEFPFSIGTEVQFFTSFSKLGSIFNITDLSGTFRYPFGPRIQPYIQLGIMTYSIRYPFMNSTLMHNFGFNSSINLDHFHLYGSIGGTYIKKITKNTELGGSVSLGLTQGIFTGTNLEGTFSSYNLFAETAFRLALNPHYNFSLEIKPSARYILSLTPGFEDFNSLLAGLGVSANFRYGGDPDALSMGNKHILIKEERLNSLFASMHNYYSRKPAGTITIKNNSPFALENLEVEFFQKEVMNYPTPGEKITRLEAGEERQINLYAVFNNQIFLLEGITPLTGEVIIHYSMRGRRMAEVKNISFDLYDKRSLIWDDDRKIAAFITPADSSVNDYAAFINRICRKEEKQGIPQGLQNAIQIYQALSQLGCVYQKDPVHPFTRMEKSYVDTISLARNTLKRLAGDCDDLTVLYCTLMETLGIETGFIRLPGHILPAVSMGIPSDQGDEFFSRSPLFFTHQGRIWLPLEITLLGKEKSFMNAWRAGSEMIAQGDFRFYPTRKAQETFFPVSLTEGSLGINYNAMELLSAAFSREMESLKKEYTAFYTECLAEKQSKELLNQLGNVYSFFEDYNGAEDCYTRALSIDKQYLFPRVNLGNLAFYREDYQTAVEIYHSLLESKNPAVEIIRQDILFNLYISYCALEDFKNAGIYLEELSRLAPEKAKEYSFLNRKESDLGRDVSAEIIRCLKFVRTR